MKRLLIPLLFSVILVSCTEDAFVKQTDAIISPKDLKYMDITNAQEGKSIVSSAPTVSTGGLIPYFEIVNIVDENGNVLDESYMNYVTIANAETSKWNLTDKSEYPINEQGDTIKGGVNFDLSNAGVITIAEGNKFSNGDYYFTIKVTTETKDKTFSTVFEKAFHIYVKPLLPPFLLYQPKTQNLIYGLIDSKTSSPLIPIGNKDIIFELEDNVDKIMIESSTGVVSLTSDYVYNGYDTIAPNIKVTSNISGESVSFSGSLIIIVTDQPEVMPLESMYFFYPTLSTTGAYPTGGDGFTVQTLEKGISGRIWGPQANSVGGTFVAPPERPEANKAQKPIEAWTNSSASATTPTNFWCVMTTQNLTIYNIGYKILMRYYYLPAFQSYLPDGRTPTDMEVYISTDYMGGVIQNTDGSWANGTWKRINEEIVCRIGTLNGEPWGEEFTGTPYPGNQSGDDPDNKKNPERSPYHKWVQCSYDITDYKDCTNFTVAFKVASYFTGELLNNTTSPGRGGRYFMSDFHYVATEVTP